MTSKAGGIAVDNAGLVLLNHYLSMLFARLELLDGERFSSPEAAARAVAALHYLATGLQDSAAHPLPLARLLAGLALDASLAPAALADSDRTLCDTLLRDAIGHWAAIGPSSIAGFRGNFLIRPGRLRQAEGHWHLAVEKRAYDVLLNQSPFNFSRIRFPWMPQSLHVTWPY